MLRPSVLPQTGSFVRLHDRSCRPTLSIISRMSSMRRLALIVLVFIIVSSVTLPAQAGEKPLISVLDFRTSGISQAEVEVFVDFLSSHIIETGKFRVIDRMQREALLKEMEFSYDDCTDEGCPLGWASTLRTFCSASISPMSWKSS